MTVQWGQATESRGGVGAHPGIILGAIERIDATGIPYVLIPGHSEQPARSTTNVTVDSLRTAAVSGAPVVIALTSPSEDDAPVPVIIGIVAEGPVTADAGTPSVTGNAGELPEARVDGRRVELTGREEVVLRCGDASITLTKAGKVLLRGTYVSSRSSGVNRIKGGSVQIN